MILLAVTTAMLVVASGAAFALVRDCKASQDYCFGSKGSDTLRGSPGSDLMIGLAGNDTMKGNDAYDEMYGGKDADKIHGMRGGDLLQGDRGADVIYGGRGNEDELWGGEFNVYAATAYPDNSNDRVYGGPGDDYIIGGKASAGVDRVFGDDGDDTIDAEQTGDWSDYAVTKEIVDCGAGNDTVYYDEGLDVLENCENALPDPAN